MRKILELIRELMERKQKDQHTLGYEYAASILKERGWEAYAELHKESIGKPYSTVGEAEYGQGIRDAIIDHKAFNNHYAEYLRNGK